MATSRPFAYNTGASISGTTQFGSLIVGDINADYGSDYGGVKWWGGPDEDLRYVIGTSRPGGQPVPSGVTGTAQVGFWGTPLGDKTQEAFLNLANYVGSKNGQPPFVTTNDAVTWLNSNGYFTNFTVTTPTPTPTNTLTPTVTETPTGTPSETPTNTPTPTTTDLSSVTTFTISGCTNLNVLVADLGPSALAPGDVFNFTFTGGTPSGCYRIVEKTAATPTDGATPLLFYVNCAACEATLVTPTPTTTSTPTPSVTNTQTPSVTPTLTQTPTNTETTTPTPTLTQTPTPTSGATGDFTVTISQQGPDVVWSGSGSFNTTSLISNGTDELTAGFSAPNAAWAIGDPTPPGPTLDVYSGVTTFPTSFGTAGGIGTPSGSGDNFGILPNGTNRNLLVPTGYTSGSFISGSTTYAGSTIAGMGLSGGTYTWAWGSGGNASSIVMTITP